MPLLGNLGAVLLPNKVKVVVRHIVYAYLLGIALYMLHHGSNVKYNISIRVMIYKAIITIFVIYIGFVNTHVVVRITLVAGATVGIGMWVFVTRTGCWWWSILIAATLHKAPYLLYLIHQTIRVYLSMQLYPLIILKTFHNPHLLSLNGSVSGC